MLLDLGSGPNPRYGHEGVDKVAHDKVTWLCDLDVFPWVFRSPKQWITSNDPPLPDDSVRGANSSHLVEHVTDLVGFMGELWRVMKDGAEVTIQHPYQFNVRAWQDPTHVRCINEISWFYFDQNWRGDRPEFGATDFELIECDAIPEENWKEMAKEDPAGFERAARNQINVIADLKVILRCRK